MTPCRAIVGCMTGTSLDGLDAALVRVEGRGLGLRARVARTASRPLGELGVRLRSLASGGPHTAREIAAMSRDLALLHADAVREAAGGAPIDLVAAHGQTVFHAPPLSWQVLNAAVLAHAVRAPVVFDLRAADLAAGGQGAPITPIADAILFGDPGERRSVVNLGGFCNVTRLPRVESVSDALWAIEAADVCACNHLLDAAARAALGAPLDADGAAASRGRPVPRVVAALADRLESQRASGRSLGTGDECASLIAEHGAGVAPDDLCRSVCEAVAGVVASAIGACDRVLLAGGGARNRVLVGAIASRVGVPVETTASHGVGVGDREAAAMAVLGALCEDGVPITLPRVTGCARPAPVAGCWARP
ncbi:MAG: anhydro-N-acetylmuramic acid kinase [Phycisphaerales bacterium]|nr:anhydro-N-acetylmuramic acid kinase [Phycisphaerales bacterium]